MCSSDLPWRSGPVAGPLLLGVALLASFGWWQCRTPDAMIPPHLLRARSLVSASWIYLISYTAFSGVMFYVTLLYQDVDGWPVLRTGLSWLFLNAPFLLLAQLAGRLDRRFSARAVICAGCLAAAAGLLALSLASPATPFVLTAVGFVVAGAGFGALVPAITHVAMRDVPPGASGAASGLLNSSRQAGTSVGLAVLGSIGVGAATASWAAQASRFPPLVRAAARGQAQNVGGGRIAAVARALGPAYRPPAAGAFVHGYHLAVGAGTLCLLLAALATAALPAPGATPAPGPDEVSPRQAAQRAR